MLFCGTAWWLWIAGVATTAGALDLEQQLLRPLSNTDKVFDGEFDEFVERALLQWHVPGISIAVVDNGTISSKGYGLAVLPDQKATADTQYFTGSTTKAFTAAAVGLLVHNDSYPGITWSSAIKDLLPHFGLEDEYATFHTTIEDALSHRTGLPLHDLMVGQPHDTPSSIVKRMRHLAMTAPPRSMFQYSDMMYTAIANLLETVSGQKLETLFADNFWRPLGMTSTTFAGPPDIKGISRLARGYYWYAPDDEFNHRGRYLPEPFNDLPSTLGAAGTISTVKDYALWIKALLDATHDDQTANTSSPITSKLLRDLVTPRAIAPEPNMSFMTPPLYALGWFTFKSGGEKIIGHLGTQTGFGTDVYLLPEHNYGIVTMANAQLTGNAVGSLIVSRFFKEKVKQTASLQELEPKIEKCLSEFPRNERRQASQPRETRTASKSLPLPIRLSELAGKYSNAAYGIINVTIAVDKTSPLCDNLEILFYPRTWPKKFQLTHSTGTAFTVKRFTPHGLGNIASGKSIVWEDDNVDYRAKFELGVDGETERLGLEMDESMIEMATNMGPKHWWKGMVWFQKH